MNNKIENQILAWCRSNPVGYGIPCMRVASAYILETTDRKEFYICDNAYFSSPILFDGDSWNEVLNKINAAKEQSDETN